MIKNRIKLTIGGAEYPIITEDDPKYVAELGAELDAALKDTLKDNRSISTTQAAVLLALQYADSYKKAVGSADNLRSQIKDYLDDAASAKSKAINAAKITSSAIPPTRLMVKLSCPEKKARAEKTATNSTASKETGKSRFKSIRSTFIGCIMADTPPTTNKLNKLEPSTLPTAIPL